MGAMLATTLHSSLAMHCPLIIFALLAVVIQATGFNMAHADSNIREQSATPLQPHKTKSIKPVKSIELKSVEETSGPLSIKVSGALQPNDGLTDLKLTIRLRNNGAIPLALMNGGTTREPQRGMFFVEADGEGVVTLMQKAYPLPDPNPAVPITTAATVLAADASVSTTWQATLEAVTQNRPYMGFPNSGAPHPMPKPISKIRVCVAYKNFDANAFEVIKGHKGFFMPIGAIVDEQKMVCSPILVLNFIVQ
jgi:hypothetical protein